MTTVFNQGYEVYSCDCFGALIQWDLRSKRRPNKNWELGPCALNSLAVDPAGKYLLVCYISYLSTGYMQVVLCAVLVMMGV